MYTYINLVVLKDESSPGLDNFNRKNKILQRNGENLIKIGLK